MQILNKIGHSMKREKDKDSSKSTSLSASALSLSSSITTTSTNAAVTSTSVVSIGGYLAPGNNQGPSSARILESRDTPRGLPSTSPAARSRSGTGQQMTLHDLCREGQAAALAAHLNNLSAVDISKARDTRGRSLLHEASEAGDEAATTLLLKRGVYIDPRDEMGRTPLQLAVLQGHLQIVAILLAHHASPNVIDAVLVPQSDSPGSRPASEQIQPITAEKHNTAPIETLLFAISSGVLPITNRMLYDVMVYNCVDKRDMLQWLKSDACDPTLLQQLTDRGVLKECVFVGQSSADDATYYRVFSNVFPGSTPLAYACQLKLDHIAALLLAHGAVPAVLSERDIEFLQSVTQLDLSLCHLTGISEQFSALSGLQALNLCGNALHSLDCDWIRFHPALKKIALSAKPTEPLPPDIAVLCGMQSLSALTISGAVALRSSGAAELERERGRKREGKKIDALRDYLDKLYTDGIYGAPAPLQKTFGHISSVIDCLVLTFEYCAPLPVFLELLLSRLKRELPHSIMPDDLKDAEPIYQQNSVFRASPAVSDGDFFESPECGLLEFSEGMQAGIIEAHRAVVLRIYNILRKLVKRHGSAVAACLEENDGLRAMREEAWAVQEPMLQRILCLPASTPHSSGCRCQPTRRQYPLAHLVDTAPVAVLARQLFLHVHALFANVPPQELLLQRFCKHVSSPNYHRCIKLFNYISIWCTTSILSEENINRRARVWEKFVELEKSCVDLNDWFSAAAISSSFCQTSVYRLNRTQKEVSELHKKLQRELSELTTFENNFASYRAAVSQSVVQMDDSPHKAVLPYLVPEVRDLLYFEELQTVLPDGKLNIMKLRKISDKIQFFERLRLNKPELEWDDEVHSCLSSIFNNPEEHLCTDEDAQMRLSLLIEPRVPEQVAVVVDGVVAMEPLYTQLRSVCDEAADLPMAVRQICEDGCKDAVEFVRIVTTHRDSLNRLLRVAQELVKQNDALLASLTGEKVSKKERKDRDKQRKSLEGGGAEEERGNRRKDKDRVDRACSPSPLATSWATSVGNGSGSGSLGWSGGSGSGGSGGSGGNNYNQAPSSAGMSSETFRRRFGVILSPPTDSEDDPCEDSGDDGRSDTIPASPKSREGSQARVEMGQDHVKARATTLHAPLSKEVQKDGLGLRMGAAITSVGRPSCGAVQPTRTWRHSVICIPVAPKVEETASPARSQESSDATFFGTLKDPETVKQLMPLCEEKGILNYLNFLTDVHHFHDLNDDQEREAAFQSIVNTYFTDSSDQFLDLNDIAGSALRRGNARRSGACPFGPTTKFVALVVQRVVALSTATPRII